MFRTFRSKNHAIATRKLSKKFLSCIDDKRYLLSDGITSLPYGHRDIPPHPQGAGARARARAPGECAGVPPSVM